MSSTNSSAIWKAVATTPTVGVLGTSKKAEVSFATMTSKNRATEAFGKVEPDLIELSDWLYSNPETAYEEHESSRRLAEFLASHGFQVEYPAYGLATAFEANVGSAGPRVVICAEYDALPGIGHACGHNIIATSSLGAGIALADLADELGIRITVLGTPGEEGKGGKIDLINAGAFDDTAASMLIHPSVRNIADPRILALQGILVTYTGKEAHAAASPHAGRNALDAFVQAYNNIATARQQFESGDRVHGIITDGGLAPNIIPARTESWWLVRAESIQRFQVLRERVVSCFEAAAIATGCSVEISDEGHAYEELVSHPTMVELFVTNSEALGREMPTFSETGEMTYASTDMGNVSRIVPSIHPSLAIETSAVNHQPEFADATITPSGHQAIRDGALAMAHTIIDLATQDLWDRLSVASSS